MNLIWLSIRLIVIQFLLLSQKGTAVFVEQSTCFQPGMSSLYVSCSSKKYYMLHCVLDDDFHPGIGCLKFIRVEKGSCPYYSKVYGELDYRDCIGGGSLCPTIDYQSYDVHKYPGCLNSTLYTTEPPPTTSIPKKCKDGLTENVTDTHLDRYSLIAIKILLLSQEGTAVFVKVPTCFQPGMSSLYISCSSQKNYILHCVLDDDYQPGIGCLKTLRVEKGSCPYYFKKYKKLSYRDCIGGGSLCPTNDYYSYDVYKYPGCLKRTLYVTEPPPTTSIPKTSKDGLMKNVTDTHHDRDRSPPTTSIPKTSSDELTENVTDTHLDRCSDVPDTTSLKVFLAFFVVISVCLMFLMPIMYWKRKTLKAHAVSFGCRVCIRNGNSGNRRESDTSNERTIALSMNHENNEIISNGSP